MFHAPEPHILLFRREKSDPMPSDFGRHAEHLADQMRNNRMDLDLNFPII